MTSKDIQNFVGLAVIGLASTLVLACCKQRGTDGRSASKLGGVTEGAMANSKQLNEQMEVLQSLQFEKEFISAVEAKGLAVVSAGAPGEAQGIETSPVGHNVSEFSVELPRQLKSGAIAQTPMHRLRFRNFYDSLQPISLNQINLKHWQSPASPAITVADAIRKLVAENAVVAGRIGDNVAVNTGHVGLQVILVPAGGELSPLPVAYNAFTSSEDPAAAFLFGVGQVSTAAVLSNAKDITNQAMIPGQYIVGSSLSAPKLKDLPLAQGNNSIPAYLFVHLPLVQDRPADEFDSKEGARLGGAKVTSAEGRKLQPRLGQPLIVLTYLVPVMAPLPSDTSEIAAGILKTNVKDAVASWNRQVQ